MKDGIKKSNCEVCGKTIIKIKTYTGKKHWRHEYSHKIKPVADEQEKVKEA